MNTFRNANTHYISFNVLKILYLGLNMNVTQQNSRITMDHYTAAYTLHEILSRCHYDYIINRMY